MAGQLQRLGPAAAIAVAILAGTLIAARPALAAQATQITAGSERSCALTDAGGVKCWGLREILYAGRFTMNRIPVGVTGLASGVTQVAAGGHICALTEAGGVKCWGDNNSGELGDNTTIYRGAPVDVIGLASGVTQVAAGGGHTCALTTGGGVKCWGNNDSGQLGDNTTTERHTPVDVVGLASGVIQIAAGGYHTCALTGGGGVKCWGANPFGELGDNTTTDRHTPVDVTGLASGVTQVATDDTHTCALTAAGGVKCWGWNVGGELGDGTTTERDAPVDVTGLASGVIQVATGGGFASAHTCAITAAGGAKCWGTNDSAELGDGTRRERHTPVDVTGLASGVAQITAGEVHTCALTVAGDVKCWGDNHYGELGDNSTLSRRVPVFVSGFGGIPTKTTLRSSRPRAHKGQRVTYTATVSPTPAGGRITFADGVGAISGCWRVPIVNGRARCTVRYTKPGAHKITARYLGSVVHKASTSPRLVQTVL